VISFRKGNARLRLLLVFFCSIAICVVAFSYLRYKAYHSQQAVESLDSLSVIWNCGDIEKRRTVSQWVLGEYPKRNSAYRQSRLLALAKSDVLSALGSPTTLNSDSAYFDFGRLEQLGFDDWLLYWIFPVEERDFLYIMWDESERITIVETRS
jgi:hypothetical protein